MIINRKYLRNNKDERKLKTFLVHKVMAKVELVCKLSGVSGHGQAYINIGHGVPTAQRLIIHEYYQCRLVHYQNTSALLRNDK